MYHVRVNYREDFHLQRCAPEPARVLDVCWDYWDKSRKKRTTHVGEWENTIVLVSPYFCHRPCWKSEVVRGYASCEGNEGTSNGPPDPGFRNLGVDPYTKQLQPKFYQPALPDAAVYVGNRGLYNEDVRGAHRYRQECWTAPTKERVTFKHFGGNETKRGLIIAEELGFRPCEVSFEEMGLSSGHFRYAVGTMADVALFEQLIVNVTDLLLPNASMFGSEWDERWAHLLKTDVALTEPEFYNTTTTTTTSTTTTSTTTTTTSTTTTTTTSTSTTITVTTTTTTTLNVTTTTTSTAQPADTATPNATTMNATNTSGRVLFESGPLFTDMANRLQSDELIRRKTPLQAVLSQRRLPADESAVAEALSSDELIRRETPLQAALPPAPAVFFDDGLMVRTVSGVSKIDDSLQRLQRLLSTHISSSTSSSSAQGAGGSVNNTNGSNFSSLWFDDDEETTTTTTTTIFCITVRCRRDYLRSALHLLVHEWKTLTVRHNELFMGYHNLTQTYVDALLEDFRRLGSVEGFSFYQGLFHAEGSDMKRLNVDVVDPFGMYVDMTRIWKPDALASNVADYYQKYKTLVQVYDSLMNYADDTVLVSAGVDENGTEQFENVPANGSLPFSLKMLERKVLPTDMIETLLHHNTLFDLMPLYSMVGRQNIQTTAIAHRANLSEDAGVSEGTSTTAALVDLVNATKTSAEHLLAVDMYYEPDVVESSWYMDSLVAVESAAKMILVLMESFGPQMEAPEASLKVLQKAYAKALETDYSGVKEVQRKNFVLHEVCYLRSTREVSFYGPDANCNLQLRECHCDSTCAHVRHRDCCLKCWPPAPVGGCDFQPQIQEKFPRCRPALDFFPTVRALDFGFRYTDRACWDTDTQLFQSKDLVFENIVIGNCRPEDVFDQSSFCITELKKLFQVVPCRDYTVNRQTLCLSFSQGYGGAIMNVDRYSVKLEAPPMCVSQAVCWKDEYLRKRATQKTDFFNENRNKFSIPEQCDALEAEKTKIHTSIPSPCFNESVALSGRWSVRLFKDVNTTANATTRPSDGSVGRNNAGGLRQAVCKSVSGVLETASPNGTVDSAPRPEAQLYGPEVSGWYDTLFVPGPVVDYQRTTIEVNTLRRNNVDKLLIQTLSQDVLGGGELYHNLATPQGGKETSGFRVGGVYEEGTTTPAPSGAQFQDKPGVEQLIVWGADSNDCVAIADPAARALFGVGSVRMRHCLPERVAEAFVLAEEFRKLHPAKTEFDVFETTDCTSMEGARGTELHLQPTATCVDHHDTSRTDQRLLLRDATVLTTCDPAPRQGFSALNPSLEDYPRDSKSIETAPTYGQSIVYENVFESIDLVRLTERAEPGEKMPNATKKIPACHPEYEKMKRGVADVSPAHTALRMQSSVGWYHGVWFNTGYERVAAEYWRMRVTFTPDCTADGDEVELVADVGSACVRIPISHRPKFGNEFQAVKILDCGADFIATNELNDTAAIPLPAEKAFARFRFFKTADCSGPVEDGRTFDTAALHGNYQCNGLTDLTGPRRLQSSGSPWPNTPNPEPPFNETLASSNVTLTAFCKPNRLGYAAGNDPTVAWYPSARKSENKTTPYKTFKSGRLSTAAERLAKPQPKSLSPVLQNLGKETILLSSAPEFNNQITSVADCRPGDLTGAVRDCGECVVEILPGFRDLQKRTCLEYCAAHGRSCVGSFFDITKVDPDHLPNGWADETAEVCSGGRRVTGC